MAQESYKKLEQAQKALTKKCGCSTTYVQIACQLSLLILLIICVVSLERRITFLEKRVDSVEEENSKVHSKHKQRLAGHVPANSRLSSLANKLRSLEERTNELSKTLHLKKTSSGEIKVDQPVHTGHKGSTLSKGAVKGTGVQQQIGVAYTLWGRSNCSGDASLVYHGYMANGHYKRWGSGSNYVCLTSDVKYSVHSHSTNTRKRATIHGVRYYTTFGGFKNNVNEHLVPCAVCYVDSRGSQIMVPATNMCPKGWAVEYHGYLMSADNQNHHSSQFVCVDERAAAGGTTFADGATLYVVQGHCGALPCKLFPSGYQLTCVVCTK